MAHHSDQYRRIARKTWIRHYGPIPAGHQIHHKDGDDTNFDIGNLECWTAKQHIQHHVATSPARMQDCLHCGTQFGNPWPYKPAKFCSNACKSAARRASGVDDERRICEKCRQPYMVNRYKKQRFCCLMCSDPGSYPRHNRG